MIAIIVAMFIPTPIVVGKYDSVEMDYTVWESDEAETYNPLNPVFDARVWVTLIPITENDTTGLILGLYNNLLGKGRLYESNLIWLNKCIDQNRDGIDDNTSQVALTYGNSTDQYFNTCLMIRFKILTIQKYSPSLPSFDITNNIVLRIVVIIGLIILGVVAAIPIGFFINSRIQKRKATPQIYYRKLASYKSIVIKYGGLAGSLALISYLFLSVWLSYPPAEFSMMISRYPFLIPLLITMTIVICVAFTFIYLFLFRNIVDRIKRKKEGV